MSSFCCARGMCERCLAIREESWAIFEHKLTLRYKRRPSPSKQDTFVDEEIAR